jgi:glycosyltransferase involved in cell wall biosynthesis
MRLIHVTPTYLPAVRYGGPIVAVHGLCAALAQRGHQVEVFTTSIDGDGNSDVPLGTPVMRDGVQVRYFASPALRRLSWAPGLGAALRDAIPAADIVHLHSVFLWPTAVAGRLARRSGKPYVVSPRGMLVDRLIARRHRLLKQAWLALIEQRNLESAAAIHATSATEAAELGKFGLGLPGIVAIPNGAAEVEAEPIPRPPEDLAGLAAMRPLLLAFGRLSWTKRLDEVIEAFAATRCGALAIVGTDDEGLAPSLRAQAEAARLGSRFHLVPRTVTGEEKEFVFAAADAFVMASLSESFGNAGVEAMQRGLPVIAAAATGIAELVAESGGGIVVDNSAAALTAAMDTLTGDSELTAQLGRAARDYVERCCRWATVAARMEALYESVLTVPRQ